MKTTAHSGSGDGFEKSMQEQVKALLTAPPAGPHTADLARNIDYVEGVLETSVGTVEIRRYQHNRDVYVIKVSPSAESEPSTFLMNRDGQFLCIDGDPVCTFEDLSKAVGQATAKESRDLYMDLITDPPLPDELRFEERSPAAAAVLRSRTPEDGIAPTDLPTVANALNSAAIDPSLMRSLLIHQGVNIEAIAPSDKFELVLKARDETFVGFSASELEAALADPDLLVEIGIAVDVGINRGALNKLWTKVLYETS